MSETKALKPVDELKSTLVKMEPQFKMALPAHIPPERFIRIVQTAVSTQPGLLSADRTSLFGACMSLAQQGLLPDNREAALVLFGSKVTAMPMVAGILKKIRNSGELSSITAQIVHEHDEFQYWVDADGEHLSHRPKVFGDRGKEIGVYALAKTKDGAVYIEVMTTQQIESVRKVSRSKDTGPWAGPFQHEMWKKTAIRRLSKRLPMSTDLETAINTDDEMFQPAPQAPEPAETEVEVKAAPKRSRLKDAIKPETPVETITQEPPVDVSVQDVPI